MEPFGTKVLPTWRPDKAMAVENPKAYVEYLDKLGEAADMDIDSYAELIEALRKRHGYFASMGCMMLFMPLFSLYLTFQFPAGIGLYWIASNVFSFILMIVTGIIYSPSKLIARDMVDETVRRRSKENYIKRLSEIKNKDA